MDVREFGAVFAETDDARRVIGEVELGEPELEGGEVERVIVTMAYAAGDLGVALRGGLEILARVLEESRDILFRNVAASLNPIVKVLTGRSLWTCINAATVDESIPPDRKTPSGTSAIIRSDVASRKSASSSSTASRSDPRYLLSTEPSANCAADQ